MGHFLLRIGKRLMISKRNRSVRGEIVFLFTHLLLLAGIIFTLEIILILMGMGNVFIPFTQKLLNFIVGMLY